MGGSFLVVLLSGSLLSIYTANGSLAGGDLSGKKPRGRPTESSLKPLSICADTLLTRSRAT